MRLFLVIFIVFLSVSSWAQRSPRISSDRPGQADGSNVTGTGVFQVQSGIDYQRLEFTNSQTTRRTLNNVLRMGLSENFELRSVVDFRSETFERSTTGEETTFDGVSQFELGFRYNLIADSDGLIPSLGFQTQFQMKNVGSAFRPNEVAPILKIATSHNLTDRFSLALNGIYAQTGNSNVPIYGYVVSVTQEISSIFSTVYEVYGNEFNDTESTYLGFGVAYRMNNDFQFDTYLSSGENSGVKEFYFTFGVSWRLYLFDSLL